MSTTAVVAEILIVGLEASAWLLLLAVTVLGPEPIDAARVRDWQGPLTLLLVALAYVIGVLADRVSDSLAHSLPRFRRTPADADQMALMRMAVLREGGAVAAFSEYQRSRLRIARGTALMLGLSVPVLPFFLALRAHQPWALALAGAAVALAAGALALWVYRRIEQAYQDRLRGAYANLQAAASRSPTRPPR